jgi:hypothetical protein
MMRHGRTMSNAMQVTIMVLVLSTTVARTSEEGTCTMGRRLLAHENDANSVTYDTDWGKPPCECITAGNTQWTGVEVTVSLVTLFRDFVDPGHPLQRDFSMQIARLAGERLRAVNIHSVDALEMGVRVSLSVRVEDCGPDCYDKAKLLAEKLESTRLSNETFFNAEHPITCTCSQVIWPGMSVASGVSGCRQCEDCRPGQYQDDAGAESCKLCPAGTYQPNGGMPNCTLCNPGKYLTSIGSDEESDCVPCPRGTYSTLSGATTCQNCSAHSDSPLASVANESCTCNRVYIYMMYFVFICLITHTHTRARTHTHTHNFVFS